MNHVRQNPPILVGVSAAIDKVRSSVLRLARTRLPVLVRGPTGSGKDLIAQLVHHHSGRTGPFVPINTCAISEGMVEATLFGHVRGAFTSASADAEGLLAVAHGGSLFLDEIGSMSPSVQGKLLRAIEIGTFRPVGSPHEKSSDLRIISATNEPLDELVRKGSFRLDLLHRLSGLVVSVPALRERPEDIAPLVVHFAAVDTDLDGATFTSGAVDTLERHDWPGNVRELRNVLRRAVALSSLRPVTAPVVREALSHGWCSPAVQDSAERAMLMELLERVSWDTEEASSQLRIHRATLYRWMARNEIPPSGRRTLAQVRAKAVRA